MDLLAALLQSADPALRERAWEQFVAEHSRLILHTIRQQGGTHDEVMDRYAFVLEQLRADEAKRLRTWQGESRLTTWLVVVVRRLCTDYVRRRYGRIQGSGEAAADERRRRRHLVDFVADELQEDSPAHASEASVWTDSEAALRAAELRAALARTIDALPPSDQLLLTLRFRDGLSAARIAGAMSLPSPFHVYRRLNQLFESMRESLRQQGIEDSVP
jgi:RNA polymerase sigma factor (sigma-70 family)